MTHPTKQLCNCLDNECHAAPGWTCRKKALTSNLQSLCEVCGKPATQWALRDPLGKSDAKRPLCGEHGLSLNTFRESGQPHCISCQCFATEIRPSPVETKAPVMMNDIPYHTIPQDIIDKVVEVRRWFDERNVKRWSVAGVGPLHVETSERPCTCHPDDIPPRPCPRKYALSECRKAAALVPQHKPNCPFNNGWPCECGAQKAPGDPHETK